MLIWERNSDYQTYCNENNSSSVSLSLSRCRSHSHPHTHMHALTHMHKYTLSLLIINIHHEASNSFDDEAKFSATHCLIKKIQQPLISFYPGSVADMSKASLKLRADIRATLANFTFCTQELGRGDSSSGSASDYGSEVRIPLPLGAGLFLFSSLSYLSISGAS